MSLILKFSKIQNVLIFNTSKILRQMWQIRCVGTIIIFTLQKIIIDFAI